VIKVLIFNSLSSCPIPILIVSNSSLAGYQARFDCSTSLENSFTSSSSHSFSFIKIVYSTKFNHSFSMKFACDFVDELLSDFLKAEDVFVMN
jgi:hypothetical protein